MFDLIGVISCNGKISPSIIEILTNITENNKNISFPNLEISINYNETSDWSVYSDDNLLILIDGLIYNIDDLFEMKTSSQIKKLSVSEKFFHLYQKHGTTFFKKLDGEFTVIIFNKISKELFLVRDTFGVRAIYFEHSSQNIIFSNNLPMLAKSGLVTKDLNETAFWEYISVGQCLGAKTLFKNIELLPFGSFLHIKGSVKKIQRYWRIEDIPLEENEQIDLDQGYDLFSKAIARRLLPKKKIGLPLSGGLCSRTILSELLNHNIPFYCYTHGAKKCSEKNTVQNIAEHFDLNHKYYEIGRDFLDHFPRYAKQNVLLGCGDVSIYQSHNMPSFNYNKSFTNYIFHTSGSETARPFYYKNMNCNSIAALDCMPFLVKKIFRDKHGILLPKYFQDHIQDYISNFFNKFHFVKDEYKILDLFFLYDRLCRWGTDNMRIYRKSFDITSPYLTRDFVEFGFSMPLRMRLESKLHLHILKKNSLFLLKEPLSDGVLPENLGTFSPTQNNSTKRNYLFEMIKYSHASITARKFRNYINSKTDSRLNSEKESLYHTNYYKWSREQPMKSELEDLLFNKNSIVTSFVSKKKLRKCFDLHQLKAINYTTLFTEMATLELWHKQFIR